MEEGHREPPIGLSCPDRNLAVFHHYRHYEGLRLLPSVYDSKLIQQTLAKLYNRYYHAVACYAENNLKGDKLEYYYRITD